jgi:hypothetical protein
MADLIQFPPLPAIPDPPTGLHDERQSTFRRIAGGLAEELSGSAGGFGTANVTTGYPASAVDLGGIQDVIETALHRFDMAQVRSRWTDTLFPWLRRMLLTWIQRCKSIHFDLEEKGIRLQLQTQDDRGYYHYEFDVFPGRKHG